MIQNIHQELGTSFIWTSSSRCRFSFWIIFQTGGYSKDSGKGRGDELVKVACSLQAVSRETKKNQSCAPMVSAHSFKTKIEWKVPRYSLCIGLWTEKQESACTLYLSSSNSLPLSLPSDNNTDNADSSQSESKEVDCSKECSFDSADQVSEIQIDHTQHTAHTTDTRCLMSDLSVNT